MIQDSSHFLCVIFNLMEDNNVPDVDVDEEEECSDGGTYDGQIGKEVAKMVGL